MELAKIKQRLEILWNEVEKLEASGGGGSPTDAYTKAQTDALLNAKADKSTTYTKTEVDYEIDSEVGTAIASLDVSSTSATGHVIRSIGQEDGKIAAVAELVDTTPTTGSTKLCTSGGIYEAIQAAAGGGGTDLTPVDVGAKAATFPTEYVYVLEKHLPFITGNAPTSYSGKVWTYYAEDNNNYYYIEYLLYGYNTGAPSIRFATINKSDKTWTQDSETNITDLMTGKQLPNYAFLGHTTYLSSTQNLNALGSGIWFSNNSANITNSPTTNPFSIVSEDMKFKSPSREYIKQTLTDFTTNDVYYRTCNNGTWSSWYKITATVVS